jgi:hypothetical protein
MPELKISPKFTIADIHKVREYCYELKKNMTREEEDEYYMNITQKVESEIKTRREKQET